MRLKVLAAAAGLMLFCSCGAVSVSGTGVESLLEAPKLNKRQAEVSAALDASLQFRSIVYKYPQSGEYLSPFIFFDFNGDDVDEAIVLYSYANEASEEVRAKVLSQIGAGAWAPVYDVPLRTDTVEFVRFEKLLNDTESCMLVGCGTTGRNSPSSLQIYSMSKDNFKLEASYEYYSYTVGDFGGSFSEIVVIGRDASRDGFKASLLSGARGGIEAISELELSSDVEMPLKLTAGNFGAGKALYIDEALQGGARPTIATEIIQAANGGMKTIAGGDRDPDSESGGTARSNYEMTFRNEEIFCIDVDGDGVVEIPNPVDMPGSYGETDSDAPKLVRLMHLTESGFDAQDLAAINQESGYLVYFPERWKDTVVVESDRENYEWHFRKWNTGDVEPAEELLRIRVSSTKDYLDLFEDYTPLAARGTTSYTAYIPKIEGEPLAVTEPEVKSMFRLLPIQ